MGFIVCNRQNKEADNNAKRKSKRKNKKALFIKIDKKPGGYNLRYADDSTLMAASEEEFKSLLMKVKKESGKFWLKTQLSKI